MTVYQDMRRMGVLAGRLVRIQALASVTAAEMQQISERLSVLPAALGGLGNLMGTGGSEPAALFSRPIVDAAAMTVTFRGRACCLRNRVLFNLLDRIARRPNHFVPYERLLRDAWAGESRTDEAIRNAVYRLKVLLRAAGMSELAAAVQSAGRRCGLMLDAPGEPDALATPPEPVAADPTPIKRGSSPGSNGHGR